MAARRGGRGRRKKQEQPGDTPLPPTRGVFEGEEPRRPDLKSPHMQCSRCKKMIVGYHNGWNPGVKMGTETPTGIYPTDQDARIAGERQEDLRGISHASCANCKAEWEREYAELGTIEDNQLRKERMNWLSAWLFNQEGERPEKPE